MDDGHLKWLWLALAAACLLAVWIPGAISLVHPVYAFDEWGLISGYIGVSWLAPAALVGLAIHIETRSRGVRRPRLLACASAFVIGFALLLALSTWGVVIEGRWQGSLSDQTTATAPERERQGVEPRGPTTTPAGLVYREARGGRRIESVQCVEGSVVACVVTLEGPACQLWIVKDGEAIPAPGVVEGASGSRSGSGVRCGS